VSDVVTYRADSIDNCMAILSKNEHQVRLRIFHLNIRSVNSNFSELLVLLQSFNFLYDLIILTETWVIHHIDLFKIAGYNLFYNGSNFNKNDGVIVYAKDNIAVNIRYDSIKNLTFTLLNFCLFDHTFSLLGLYRPPSYSEADFLEQLEGYIGVNCKSQINLLVGDINFDILKDDRISIQKYTNILNSNGFISLINTPTRISEITESCLDHMYLKSVHSLNISVTPIVLESFITDHFPTILNLNFKTKLHADKISDTYIERIDYRRLTKELETETWQLVYNSEDNDHAYSGFIQTLKNHIETCTSRVTVHPKNKKLKPWITSGLIDSIKHRDKLKKRLRRFPSDRLEREYKNYRNKLTKLITQAKYKYYNVKILEAGKNTKKYGK